MKNHNESSGGNMKVRMKYQELHNESNDGKDADQNDLSAAA